MDVRVRCVAFNNEKLVLIHRIRADKSADFYFFPGGGVDPGELPENTCVRELQEEACLTVKPVKLLGIQLHTDGTGDHCQIYFLVDIVSGTIAPGTGAEYEEKFRAEHGTHDPIELSIDEFRDAPNIHPGRIRDQLLPYIQNLSEMPFFILDERKLC